MYASSLLERWLEDNCAWMHKARRGAVCKLVNGLLRGGVATLTAMGRHIPELRAEKRKAEADGESDVKMAASPKKSGKKELSRDEAILVAVKALQNVSS